MANELKYPGMPAKESIFDGDDDDPITRIEDGEKPEDLGYEEVRTESSPTEANHGRR